MSVNQELLSVILPHKAIRLEWAEAREKVSKDQDLLQQEIFRRFTDNPDSAFLFLGFCNKSVSLSPSLDYWRTLCGLFANKLTHTPDLEVLRQKVTVEISEDEINHVLASAPMMTGAEYSTGAVIEDLWQRLLAEFRKEIEHAKGGVEDFIKQYSPESQKARQGRRKIASL